MSIKMSTKWNKGQALVEFSLLLPFLVLLLLPTVDLGRIFYFSIAVTQAARAGAQYGFQNSTDFSGMTAAAVAAGSDVGLTASNVSTADRYWRCPSDPTTTKNTDFPIPSGSCGAGSQPLIYVRVITTKDFSPLYSYPWISDTVTITRAAEMRVQ
jgi:Flp pilus assembly protein TadG